MSMVTDPQRIRKDDPGNPDVVAFLDAQVLMPASGPEMSPAVRAELGGMAGSLWCDIRL